ncbi:MAG TPA: condensation domain-containing protein, partial [Longimicrobiaceae bacterium]
MSSEPSSGLSPEHLRLLALLMEEEGVETGAAQPISRRGGEGDPPLSFAQQRLWLLDRMEPGNPAYNVPAGMRLRGALDVRALERALGEVVRRHESLRTVFAERGGEPVQTVRPATPVPLPVLDLRGRPEPAREAELRRIAAEEGARPFDLAAGPLLRAQAVRLADAEWVLLFTLHHVVSDAWSVRVLVREVSEAYAAFAAGREPSLPELPVQYADYAVWQREWLSGERLDAQLGFWRERLAGAPPVLDLPTDRPRAPDAGRAADRRGFRLAPGATEALRGLARGEGATLFAVLLAGFQALLGRWASQDDVLVGTPVAGRTRVELEGLIGFFVNTLVVRTDLSDGPTARALVARVREAVLEAQSNQDLPFERLVEELKTERSLTHTPLFQVLFTLDDDAADGALRLGDAELEPLDRDSGTAPFDLGLVVADGGAGLSGWMEFRTALFDGETVERMLEHYVRVLEGMAAAPDRPVREIPLLDGDERRRLLEEWGAAGGSGHPSDRLVHELFAGHAARTPDAPALLWGDEVVSYAELDRRAAALAARLRALGVAPEVRVAVCAERSPELPAALLAVLGAGGVYVPLDPSYPAERLRYVLADAGASVLVTQERLLGRLPEFGGKVVVMDGEHDGAAGEAVGAGCPLSPVPCPLNLAYVIYTSGSTGRPKGVAVTHGNLLDTLLAARERFGFGAGDVMPALASSAFDISLFETLGPLVSGAAVRLVPRDRVADVEALAEETEGATLLHAVPALMRQAARAVAERGGRPGMRAVFVGGEAVPPDLLPEMRAAFPSAALHVLYGPTEATVICASHGAGSGAPGPQHPIGRELGGARLYVCDAAGDLLP